MNREQKIKFLSRIKQGIPAKYASLGFPAILVKKETDPPGNWVLPNGDKITLSDEKLKKWLPDAICIVIVEGQSNP